MEFTYCFKLGTTKSPYRRHQQQPQRLYPLNSSTRSPDSPPPFPNNPFSLTSSPSSHPPTRPLLPPPSLQNPTQTDHRSPHPHVQTRRHNHDRRILLRRYLRLVPHLPHLQPERRAVEFPPSLHELRPRRMLRSGGLRASATRDVEQMRVGSARMVLSLTAVTRMSLTPWEGLVG